MITCRNCGAQNRDDAAFCVNCGAKGIGTPEPTEKEVILRQAEQISRLAQELAANYADGMNAMEVNVTIAREKCNAEIAQMKATLTRESERARALERDLEDARAAVRTLSTDKEQLIEQINSLKAQLGATGTVTAEAPIPEAPAPAPAVDMYAPQSAEPTEAASAPQFAFCPECGKIVTPDMFFCNECGTRLK